jgi:outer membrane biosynthesis protein TonB
MVSPANPEYSRFSVQELENMLRRSTLPEEKKAITAELTSRYSQQYLKQETTTSSPSPSSPVQPVSDSQSHPSSSSEPRPEWQWQSPPEPQPKPRSQPQSRPEPQPKPRPQPKPQRVATTTVSQSTSSKTHGRRRGRKVLIFLFLLAGVIGAIAAWQHSHNSTSDPTSSIYCYTSDVPDGYCELSEYLPAGSSCSCYYDGVEYSGTVQ